MNKLKFIFAYADTEPLEVYQAMLMIFANPVQLWQFHELYNGSFDLLVMLNIVCGMLYLWAIYTRNLLIRMNAAKFYGIITLCTIGSIYIHNVDMPMPFLVSYGLQCIFAVIIYGRLSSENAIRGC